MMKRLIAVMTVLCLVLGSMSFAMADAVTVNWEDITSRREALGLDGSFRTLNAYPVQYWIPENLSYTDPTDSEIEASVCAKYVNADGTFGLAVLVYAQTDYAGISGLADAIRSQSSDFENVTELVVNGLDAISYRRVGGTNVYAAFYMPDTAVLVFNFFGVTTDEQTQEAGVISCSVRKAAEESQVAAVTWSDTTSIREQMGISYSFVKLNAVPYQFAISEDLVYETPTEEQQQQNYIAIFYNEARDRGLAVGCSKPEEATDPSEFLAYLKTLDIIAECGMETVNGIPCVYYTRNDMTNKFFLSYFVADGVELTMQFIGVDDSTFGTIAKVIAASVMEAQ